MTDRAEAGQPGRLGRRASLGSAALGAAALAAAGCTAADGPGSPGPGRRVPFLANDRLDPVQTHGDLLLALSADQPDMLLHACAS